MKKYTSPISAAEAADGALGDRALPFSVGDRALPFSVGDRALSALGQKVPLRWCAVAFVAAVFAVLSLSAAPVPRQPADAGMEITADKFEIDQKSGWTTASGNVRLKAGEHSLAADRVRLHRDRGNIEARGNVVIEQESFGAWRGDYIEYNYKTGEGLVGIGELKAGVFSIGAKEITRREDGRFDAQKAIVTTCTNAPGHRHWCLTGHVRYKDNDYIEVFDVVPWFFGVPCAWLPYWYRDLDTHYGFRLVPGYTSRWGAYMLGGYVYNLYRPPDGVGPRLDASTHVDYRTKRGVAVGQNFRWNLMDLGRGRFEAYHAWDERYPHLSRDRNWMSDVSRDRYRFRLFHEADITPRDQFVLRGTYNSDSRVRHDFFERENRGESIPMNFVSLSHREHTWAGGGVVSGPLNNFYSGVSRLPEGWLNIAPQPLFGTLLNYESQTRAGYFERDYARYRRALPDYMYYPGYWADYSLTRADTAHRVTAPFKLADTLSLVPRAGYRGTWYSDSQYGSTTHRQTAELGFEAATRATAEVRPGYRHTIEPYLDYSYQPSHLSISRGQNYYFDRFDRSYEWFDQFGRDGTWLPFEWHGVRPGVRNLLQGRDSKGRTRTLADLDTYAAVQFDSEGPLANEGMRLLGARLLLSPTERLDLKAHSEWDTKRDVMAYTDLSAFYQLTEKFRFGGGYIGRDHKLYDYAARDPDYTTLVPEWDRVKENLIYGGFTHELSDTWTYSGYTRYDLLRGELDEVGGFIQFSLDCLVFQVRSSYRHSFERIDGTERKDDVRFAFLMWFRAENRSPADDWLTW